MTAVGTSLQVCLPGVRARATHRSGIHGRRAPRQYLIQPRAVSSSSCRPMGSRHTFSLGQARPHLGQSMKLFRDASRPSFTIRQAKFQQFERKETDGQDVEISPSDDADTDELPEDTRDDRVLPDSLEGAVIQASRAAAVFALAGGMRAMVELLVPDLENLQEEGAQQRSWDCARTFLEAYQQQLGGQRLKAIFPDAGAAALLRHRWADASFSIASLNDRNAVTEEDDAVVMVAPDFQMLEVVERIATSLTSVDGMPRPLVMYNPRLVSGDVGVGLNVRRLREGFLSSFTTVYQLRPLSVGAIYRSYPEPWKMFLDDPQLPGRYLLFQEQVERPNLDDIEDMMMAVVGGDAENSEEPSGVTKALGVLSSLSRFMKALSR